MTAPKLNFDWTISLGSLVSTLLWLGAAVWFASALSGSVTDLQRSREEHGSRIRTLEREGSEVARADHKRLDVLERRQEVADKTLAEMAQLLARIDENVKALKDQRK